MATSLETMQQKQLDTWLDQRLDELLPEKLKQIEAAKTPSMAIVVTKGTLDWAYPPFILASTAAALGWEVSAFFTFYGLPLLKKRSPGPAARGAPAARLLSAAARGARRPRRSRPAARRGTPPARCSRRVRPGLRR